MGFTNQVTSSFADLISKLNTFLIAEGWTTHHVPASGEFAARKTPPAVTGTFDIAFALQWDTALPGVAGIYQHLGAYNNVLQPFDQADDSGNGAQSTVSATLAGQRFISLTNTPEEFWCFTDAAGTYFHVVVGRPTASDAIHFGAGALELYGDGDITGGEYVYGHRVQTGFNNSVGILSGTSVLLDGIAADGAFPIPSNMEEFAATIHIEGFPNQEGGGSGKWAVCMGNQSTANLGTDRAAVDRARFTGGFRAGPGVLQWGEFEGSAASGLIPGTPINVFYGDNTTGDVHGPVGRMKDVRQLNMKNFVLGDTVVIGSDTWHIFPTFRKFISGSLSSTTGHQGIMYKEIP